VSFAYMCMHVCMYVCVLALIIKGMGLSFAYSCMHVGMYVCMHVYRFATCWPLPLVLRDRACRWPICECMFRRMYVCTYACMYDFNVLALIVKGRALLFAYMYVYMNVCMHVMYLYMVGLQRVGPYC